MTDQTAQTSQPDADPQDIRGSNQSGLRAYNERLVLSLVRRHGALAKADIARRTGLSAQTVSVIMRGLEADGLLEKGEPQRGKVGQPLVPISLAPRGAFFLGLKIGRRSAELVLTDFVGSVLARTMIVYDFPTPDDMIAFAEDSIAQVCQQLAPEEVPRIAGLGIAMPSEIWSWARLIGINPALMESWKHRDIAQELAERVSFPVSLQNDASAACGAEITFGVARPQKTYLYFFIGYFIGGGVVINGSLFTGPFGNAGAVGSAPVIGQEGDAVELIDVASLVTLEKRLSAAGLDSLGLWQAPRGWNLPEDIVAAWIEEAGTAIAGAIRSGTAFIDFEAAVIDGWISDELRARLVAKVSEALDALDMTGVTRPEIVAGSIGPDARALGAASLPLSEKFLLDVGAMFGGQ